MIDTSCGSAGSNTSCVMYDSFQLSPVAAHLQTSPHMTQPCVNANQRAHTLYTGQDAARQPVVNLLHYVVR